MGKASENFEKILKFIESENTLPHVNEDGNMLDSNDPLENSSVLDFNCIISDEYGSAH